MPPQQPNRADWDVPARIAIAPFSSAIELTPGRSSRTVALPCDVRTLAGVGAFEGGLKRCALFRYHQGLLCCEANRQTQDKGRTTLVSRTRSGDRPTVKLGDVLRDRETQTEATVLSAGR